MKVLILGLGQYPKGSGIAAALYFARRGDEVLVTDQKNEADIAANVRRLKRFKNVHFRLGEHRLGDIRWADMIVRNPRVRPGSPEMRLATKLGKCIESDVSLFMNRCPAMVVGVTGTRGKSTTSTLVADMLKRSKKRVWLGGNILVSPLTFLAKVKKDDVVVLELSSWLLETTGALGLSPHVACVTNLMRDHLNTYEGMEDYAEAKAQIFRHQWSDDTVVLNGDDAYGKEWMKEAPSKVSVFGRSQGDAYIKQGKLVMRDKRKMIKLARTERLRVSGEHLYMNMLAASLTARAAGATIEGIRTALRSFNGLPDRQEIVCVKRGVTYINDTTASTPDGVIAALNTFSDRFKTIRLIIGGADKELEFDELARTAGRFKADIAVLPGTAHAKLTSALMTAGVAFQDAQDLKKAMRLLRDRSVAGDAIILSPGCASFGQFRNEFERGEVFRRLAKA